MTTHQILHHTCHHHLCFISPSRHNHHHLKHSPLLQMEIFYITLTNIIIFRKWNTCVVTPERIEGSGSSLRQRAMIQKARAVTCWSHRISPSLFLHLGKAERSLSPLQLFWWYISGRITQNLHLTLSKLASCFSTLRLSCLPFILRQCTTSIHHAMTSAQDPPPPWTLPLSTPRSHLFLQIRCSSSEIYCVPP